MSNHLIIGLGGTGGNIIRNFRKTVYEAYSSDIAPKVNLSYLYVDSSKEFMDPDDASWKTLGHSVQLDQRYQLLIQGMNLKSVVDNLNQYPGLKPWLGDREDWRDILNAADAARVVGGQKRRLGRFLFATNASRFRDAVKRSVSEMHADKSNGVATTETTFHVCCGLAGGTGSGSVVDALCQIRLAYPQREYKIILYALLPERHPAANRAGPNYHANGYAALVELNALVLGTWHPHDVLGTDGARVHVQDAFNCCYLFNDENESNIAVTLPELAELTSSFLFQKIVQKPNIDWGTESDSIGRQEGYEFGSQGNVPEKSATGDPRRSRSFFSFGIKQIAYPEVEIREYLTYGFATQAVRQLLYNSWVEGEGYLDVPVNQNFHEYVRDRVTVAQWYLNDDRLTLSEGLLPAEINNKNWKPIGEFWKALVPHLVTEILDQYKNDWIKMLPELTNLAEKTFAEQYRGSGALRFYETKRKDMGDHVREIRSRIERDLFSSWRTGERSMHDIDRLVFALIESLEERVRTIDNRTAQNSEEGEPFKSNEAKITENRKQWAKLGPVGVAFGSHKKILNAQGEALITRYTLKTRLQGFRFGRELVQRLIQELNVLAKDVSACKLMFSDAAQRFNTAHDVRLRDKGVPDLTRPMIREYDLEKVRDFERSMIIDRAVQRRQTSAARERLILKLGDRLTFANFNAKISVMNFDDTVSASSKAEAAVAHADLVATSPERGRVLDVSLIDFLRREYEGNDEKLRAYTRTTMDMAKNFLKMSDSERQLEAPGILKANDPAQAICATCVTIIAPEAPEHAAFRDRFLGLLEGANNKAGISYKVINKSRPHEITILSITNTFPVRFVEIVGLLKEKYVARRSGPGSQRAFLELHSEGQGYNLAAGEELFDLFAESYTQADILPWFELAQALDLIQDGQDYTTGRRQLKLKIVNKLGLPEPPMDLGPDMETVLRECEPATVETLKKQVQEILKTSYIRIDKRQELAKIVFDKVRATADKAGAEAPQYKQELTAYKTVRSILELDNQ